MRVEVASTEADVRKVAGVMRQLRDTFDEETLVARMLEQQQQGYSVAWVEEDDRVLCVAGFVVRTSLAWGQHIYVDDLVTDQHQRSRGAGKAMLDWLKAHARGLGCSQLHLDSGVQRFAAHRFYLREGFDIASHHFSITELR